MKPANSKPGNAVLAILSVLPLMFIGCEFEVPITAEPTRKIEAALLGDWSSSVVDENSRCRDRMKVRKYDDSSYIVSLNGELYRAYHSDVAGSPFISVQNIDSPDRKYFYYTWRLSEDGKRMSLQFVKDDLIPKDTRDSAAVVKLLRENLGNPRLLEGVIEYRKDSKAALVKTQ